MPGSTAWCSRRHTARRSSARGIGDGAALGLRIDYANEEQPLGTGGGIRNVAPLLESRPDDPVVVLNSDILSSHDIAARSRRTSPPTPM